MSLKLILYSAITIFFNGAVLRRYLKDELLLTGPYTLIVLLPTITQPICQLIFGGFFGITIFAIASYHIYIRLPQQFVQQEGKYVFISGCDSGFGFETARTLDSKGVNVIAGCLFKGRGGEQDLVQACSDRLATVQLDVTSEESVQNAAKEVRNLLEGRDLSGVVNNAGILYMAEVEVMSLKFFQRHMDVNYLGAVRLTQALLPLIRQSKGRIVSLCSIASEGFFPQMAAYCSSKAALRATMDVLRLEMMKWGVQVSTIHPGACKTPMLSSERLAKSMSEVFDDADPSVLANYGPPYQGLATKTILDLEKTFNADLSPVVNTIEHALFAKRPLDKYLIGIDIGVLTWLFTLLPVGLSRFLVSHTLVPASAISERESLATDNTEGAADIQGGSPGSPDQEK